MRYFTILEISPEDSYDPIVIQAYTIENDVGWSLRKLIECIYIAEWSKNNTFYVKGTILEEYMEFINSIVISSGIKSDMEGAGVTGVQYLPIRLINQAHPDIEIPGYYILNILNKEPKEIIDPNTSRYAVHTYLWMGLYGDKLSGYDIFRIEGEEYKFFISDKIKKIINKHIHSVEFTKVKLS